MSFQYNNALFTHGGIPPSPLFIYLNRQPASWIGWAPRMQAVTMLKPMLTAAARKDLAVKTYLSSSSLFGLLEWIRLLRSCILTSNSFFWNWNQCIVGSFFCKLKGQVKEMYTECPISKSWSIIMISQKDLSVTQTDCAFECCEVRVTKEIINVCLYKFLSTEATLGNRQDKKFPDRPRPRPRPSFMSWSKEAIDVVSTLKSFW